MIFSISNHSEVAKMIAVVACCYAKRKISLELVSSSHIALPFCWIDNLDSYFTITGAIHCKTINQLILICFVAVAKMVANKSKYKLTKFALSQTKYSCN